MDGGRHVGIFGAIGRETKGAFRSLGYDLRRSKRFRRVGVIAVATVAGGVIAAGALVRGESVPGIADLGGDDSDIIEGWFGLGADTTGQDAESSAASSESGGETASPSADGTAEDAPARGRGGPAGGSSGSPDLIPVGGDETSGPGEEEDGTVKPSPTQDPGEEPTTEAPTSDGPSPEPTTEAPSEEPSESASESDSASESVSPTAGQTSKSTSVAPVPQKGPLSA